MDPVSTVCRNSLDLSQKAPYIDDTMKCLAGQGGDHGHDDDDDNYTPIVRPTAGRQMGDFYLDWVKPTCEPRGSGERGFRELPRNRPAETHHRALESAVYGAVSDRITGQAKRRRQ